MATVLDSGFVSRMSSSYGWETTYCGYRWDAKIGLYAVRNRFYHPLLGRWLTRDPIGYADGMSLYSAYFVPNKVDPSGLLKQDFRQVMYDLCDKCLNDETIIDCKVAADNIARVMEYSQKRTNDKRYRGNNTFTDACNGYLCWDWADIYYRIGKKYNQDGGICGQVKKIVKNRKDSDNRIRKFHFFVRFCAGEKNCNKKECCIDVDDAWFMKGNDCIHEVDTFINRDKGNKDFQWVDVDDIDIGYRNKYQKIPMIDPNDLIKKKK